MAYSSQSITMQLENAKNISMSDKALRNEALVSLGNDNYIIVNTESVLSKYKSLMKQCVNTYEITGVDEVTYRYKPTLMAFQLYGTIEMAPFILEINNMKSASEFCNFSNGLKLFNGQVATVLNEVLDREEKNIQLNREDIDAEIAKITVA